MKLQGLSVIFCLIAVPIMLILSYYIQAQVDTIALQASYDTKLIDATHDAVMAFEINTANEDLSSVSDALRSIVTASTNIFTTSLNTSLGMSNASKNNIQPYVPALLMTLYDGYYIYSPTKVPVICTSENGQAVTVGQAGTERVSTAGSYATYSYHTPGEGETENTGINIVGHEEDYGMLLYKIDGQDLYTTQVIETEESGIRSQFKLDYILKSYIPYAARYTNGSDKDVIINYTLDNFLTVYGNIGDTYYSKSGYYSNVIVESCSVPELLTNYSDEQIDEYIKTAGEGLNITINKDGEHYTIFNINDVDDHKTMNAGSAIAYYIKSYNFSTWVNNNLNDILESSIQDTMSDVNLDAYGRSSIIGDKDNLVVQSTAIASFAGKNNPIFFDGQNPEEEDSTFSLHKRDVMKNSIQYNLNLAMSVYNSMSSLSFAVNLPIFEEDTWNQITSRISLVSFMQGFDCGLKKYNNYAVISSTNNEFTVIPSEIYYVGRGTDDTGAYLANSALNDEKSEYHRIDCPDLNTDLSLLDISTGDIERGFSSFVSKEVKYDKIYDKNSARYNYDHQNLACYTCINNPNYLVNNAYVNLDFDNLQPNQKKLYLVAIGKEREELYKTNAIVNTKGLNIIPGDGIERSLTPSTLTIPIASLGDYGNTEDIASVDITISRVRNGSSPVIYADFSVIDPSGMHLIRDTSEDPANPIVSYHKIVNDQTLPQTIHLDFSLIEDGESFSGAFNAIYIATSDDGLDDSGIKFFIDSIMINYK